MDEFFFENNFTYNETQTEISVGFPFPGLVGVYVLLLCIGSGVNIFFAGILATSRRNGILTLILQLTIVDACATFPAIIEILSLSNDAWTFPSVVCSVFLSAESLISNLSKYLLICLGFHVFSVWNLYASDRIKSSPNPLTTTSMDGESNECLVPKTESTPDDAKGLRKQSNRPAEVTVAFPSSLVWFTCISLSIPQYIFSSTIKIGDNELCSIIDLHYGQLLQNIQLIFRVLVPLPLKCLLLLLLLAKLCTSRSTKHQPENILNKRTYKVERLLIFAVAMNCLYLCMSSQREALYFLHVFTGRFDAADVDSYMVPPLRNLHVGSFSGSALSILNYCAGCLRPVLYLYLLPKFKFLVKSRVMCSERKKSAV